MTHFSVSPPAVQARDIGVLLGQGTAQVQVLEAVSLDLAAGRWTSIVGPNGAGKSTLLKCLAGLQAHQGEVRLLGRSWLDWSVRDRAQQVAWLGQNQEVSPDSRVWDVVMLGRLPHQNWLAPASAQDRAAVEQALRSTEAWALRERSLGQLSGGERQRVLLARALAVQAQVLLMDEPLTNLDPPHQVDWLALMKELVAQGRTVVSVLHEIPMALCADDMVVMARGRLLHHGRCADPTTHRALEAVFDHRLQVHCLQGQWITLVQPQT